MDDRLVLRRALSEGLTSWLTFEHHCGREGLFSERYLALPIAQLLSKATSGVVVAEQNHPVLAIDGAVGRPPQLDFIIQKEGKVQLVVETKWAGTKGISVKDVIWDCVRLELAAHHYGCDAIFVLAGTRSQVETMLTSKSFNPNTKRGKPSRVLGYEGSGRWSVNIESPKWAFGDALHRQLRVYKTVSYPKSFVCGQGTQVPKSAALSSYSAVDWNIRSDTTPRRATFSV